MSNDTRRDGVVVAAVLGLVIFGTLCCGCGSVVRDLLLGPRTASEEVVRPVRLVVVAESGGAETRSFNGTSRAGDEARLSFKVAGSVRDVFVKVGDPVKPGDRIAQLETVDLALQVQQLDAALLQTDAQARNARSTYDRVRELYVQDNASSSELDAARAAVDGAEAAASAARKQRALAAQQLGYATLKASRTGSVVEVLVNPGENVSPGRPVATLASGGPPEILVGVPAGLINRVTDGMKAKATFGALAGQVFEVEVVEVGVSAGTAAAFPVTFRVLGAHPDVRPGMSAEVTVDFPPTETRSHLGVPASAVTEDRLGRFVWVVTPTEGDLGRVERRPVTLGDLTAEGLDVLDGLTPGDRVVTAGVSRIHEGQVVRLPPEEAR